MRASAPGRCLARAMAVALLVTAAAAGAQQVAQDGGVEHGTGGAGASQSNHKPSHKLAPNPGLAPEQVVRIQLDALRNNDAQNRGIEVAFRFASPANRLNTGPLARFISMIRQGPYSLMLAYENAAYHPVEIVENRARQRVTLIGSGLAVDYEFYLSRQDEGEWRGCWMTDAVVAKRPHGLQVQS